MLRYFKYLFGIALTLAFVFASTESFAKKKKKNDDAGSKKDAIKSIASITKKCKAYEGLFTIYQDTADGTAYLLIKTDQFNKEFIHFSYAVDGVVESGYFRGAYRGSRIFTINKYFNKIEFVLENTRYYFDPEKTISKAEKANINTPLFISEKIFAQNKDKTEYLIKASPVFLSENFQQIKRSPNPASKGVGFKLGKLSDKKSKYVSIKSYPENTDVVVEYVYENQYPTGYGRGEVTDARFVSVKIQHSLIAVPENDFQSRFDDPRIGYFMHQVNNMTSAS
ncbi:MAG: DUF5117 domain-containing protein, partial [Bacteroidetes bacterium]|nr:DUF5117 domain-containing protein [Bacteroidota bacterium]